MVIRYVMTEYPHETCMEEDADGNYVLHSDYVAIEARVAELESELSDAESDVDTMAEHNIELQAKVAELEKDAARYRWLRRQCDEKGSRGSIIAASHYGMDWDRNIDEAMSREA